uniref:Uncharacterized protein n=1 Tax=Anguilla anguilla TaxID=7936 RepID=A0A0E9XBL5_ANGAN
MYFSLMLNASHIIKCFKRFECGFVKIVLCPRLNQSPSVL